MFDRKSENELSTGERIKILRTRKGLKQKELAELCGMSESQIGQYENGIRNPKYQTLEKIANALEVDVAIISWFPIRSIDELDIDLNNLRLIDITKKNNFANKNQKNPIIDKILVSLDKINDKGKEKVIEYIEILEKVDEYRK